MFDLHNILVVTGGWPPAAHFTLLDKKTGFTNFVKEIKKMSALNNWERMSSLLKGWEAILAFTKKPAKNTRKKFISEKKYILYKLVSIQIFLCIW